MIKYWQSTQDYKYFLTESKVHFDSSERNRLHTELWKPWQKLRLFDTDKALEFLLPFYSATGRPAKNQPQILRSFILFFLLYSEGLAKPSLTLWVGRLRDDRVLAALIGCTQDSLPPLAPTLCFFVAVVILGVSKFLVHFLTESTFQYKTHHIPHNRIDICASLILTLFCFRQPFVSFRIAAFCDC